ncbi:MAG: alpha/beta hydrolase [Opitutaceae bacterium]
MLLALGLLTVRRSPLRWNWKFALLAGEFGHWLALGALGAGVATWALRDGHFAWAHVTLILIVLAMGMLLRPTLEAERIGRVLPAKLEAAFGGVKPTAEAFALLGYFASGPSKVVVETREYAPGLRLDFFRAVDRAAAPCVVVIHGGGWDGGDRAQLADLNHWLARRGFAVAAIDYRLAPQAIWPAQRDDTLAALNFLKLQAVELGVDAKRLVLFGRSAGGQIASAVGYGLADPAIRGVVSFYAPHDMFFAYSSAREDDFLKSPQLMRQYLGGPPSVAQANYESASGYQKVRTGSPPTLLVHGLIDTLVWNQHSVRLQARLAEARVPHVYVELPWATHAFEYNLTGPGGQLATYALEGFLVAVTR